MYLKGDKARKKIFSGIEQVSDIVASTIGPKGRNFVFATGEIKPVITNDGVTVANNIKLEDPIENIGADMIKDVGQYTDNKVGDGTTTSIILASEMIKNGMNYINKVGINVIKVKEGMKMAGELIVEQLEECSKKIESKEDYKKIALISSQDEEVGEMVAEAMQKLGTNGVISYKESGTNNGLELVMQKGMKFDRGYHSQFMINDYEKLIAKYEEVPVLVMDKKLTSLRPIAVLLDSLLEKGINNLVVICDGFEEEVLMSISNNKAKGIFNILGLTPLGIGDRRRESGKDIAIITGSRYIEKGEDLKDIVFEDLGTIKEIVSTANDTTIIAMEGIDKIESRVTELKSMAEQEKDIFQKSEINKRIARLTGGIGVIKVGYNSEIETREKLLRVEDAVNATKAAVEEGIVPGGGSILYYLSDIISYDSKDLDIGIGVEIVLQSLKKPMLCILDNAGIAMHASGLSEGCGVNANNGVCGDMIEMGIIDPKKVTRLAVENAISVASSFLTIDTVHYLK